MSYGYLPRTLVSLRVAFLGLLVASSTMLAQEAPKTDQQQVVDRFMQVLLRRPGPGTALDRVYGHHVRAGTLDEFMSDLEAEAKGSEASADDGDAGARYMVLGLMHQQRGNDAEAAQSLAKADELRNTDAMASYYLGRALLMVGRSEAATEALERAIDREPTRNLALPVYMELGRLYGRSQQSEKALAVWKRLEETFPGDARVGEQIAQTLAEEGQSEAALERYEKLAREAESADDYRTVGYRVAAAELKRHMGRGEEALADFESILGRLRPASWLYADVRRRIEASFLRNGDYAALADYYAEQVKKTPDEIELRMRLGQSLGNAGRLNEAENVLSETVKLAPNDVDARLALTDLLQAAGKADAAAGQLEELIAGDSGNPDYLVRLGNIRLDDKSMERDARRAAAAKAWLRLAEARKDDAVVTAQVGDLMRRIERTDDALSLYRRSIELDPDQPQYREYLGEYLHNLGRKDEAMRTWNSIAEGPRENRENLIRLAEVLNTFEHRDPALEAFGKAAQLDPNHAQRLRFANLLSRSKRYDDALAQLDLADSLSQMPEEREQVLKARIEVYSSSDTLAERIEEAREGLADNSKSEDYRRLALMLEAASRIAEATDAIELAVKADAADLSALTVAAELYEKSSRYVDAIDAYRLLAKSDSRFLPNYLKRIASLQMGLGRVEEAMATADELIAALPGNPEPIRFYSELCFRVNRDEKGIEMLRRAQLAAPRDETTRHALARALADRFRTDEAIELYWQLLEDTDGLSDQVGLVSAMALLYQRKGDFDRLLNRLELRGRQSSDMRNSILLTAAAHRAAKDIGAARQTLQPLLVENPRDAELLREIISLSEAADEPEVALEYQRQLVALADTPENRAQLLTLLVDCGQVDVAEASLQRLRALEDPVTMIKMIDRMVRRGDTQAAIRLCRAALNKRSDLWEVRVRLSGLLVLRGEIEEALAEADRVDGMNLPAETKSELGAPFSATRIATTSGPALALTSRPSPVKMPRPLRDSQEASLLVYFFQIGRYASSTITYYSRRGATPLAPVDFGQAKVLTLAIRFAAAAKQGKLDEFATSYVDAEELETTNDVGTVWTAHHVASIRSRFASAMGLPPASSEQADLANLKWRLAQLDLEARNQLVYSLLMDRFHARKRADSLLQPIPLQPLTEDQLRLAHSAYEDNLQSNTSTSLQPSLANALFEELVVAGKEDEASEFSGEFASVVDDASAAISSLQFHVTANRSEDVGKLLESLRDQLPDWAPRMSASERNGLSAALVPAISLKDLADESSLLAVDLAIATQSVVQTSIASRSRRSSAIGIASVNMIVNGSYTSRKISVPFSDRLLPSSFAQQFYRVGVFEKESARRRRLIAHLLDDVTIFSDDSRYSEPERKLRSVLAAFTQWWSGDVNGAYNAMSAATRRFPEDYDLWIERARLAAELNRPQAALAALDEINPLDQSTLRIRELAALNLASRLGRSERAETAATRLFGMRLDSNVEIAVSREMMRLGMSDMAKAILRRSQHRGGQSIDELLALAEQYMASDEREAAAEVAVTAFARLVRSKDRNASVMRGKAVGFLRSTDRLDPLLKQAEQRVDSAPQSLSLKRELAALYTAVGRRADAAELNEQIAKQQPRDPRTMWSTAEQLVRSRKYGEAVDVYVVAIQKQPEMLRGAISNFDRAVNSSKQSEKAYKALAAVDVRRFDSYTLGRLVSLYRRQSPTPSAAAQAFLDRVLTEAPIGTLGDVMRTLASNKTNVKTESIQIAVERVFADDSVYQPALPFWTSVSFLGSDGEVRGALDLCLEAIDENDALETKVRALLLERTTGETQDEIASLLLLAVDAKTGKLDDIDGRTRKLLENKEYKLPAMLWRQLAQVYRQRPSMADLSVVLFEKIRDMPDPRAISDYRYSVGPQLADAYVAAGHKDKAARELLRGCEATLQSPQNASLPPGYGDYQSFRALEGIVSKLVSVGAPLEAIYVYNKTLSNPQRFVAAKRFTGRTDYKDRFEKALNKVIESLDMDDYEQYLELEPMKETNEELPVKQFDLVALTEKPGMYASKTSIAAMVIDGLRDSRSGRDTLIEFNEQVAKRIAAGSTDHSLQAMQAMVSIELGLEEATEQITQLMAMLPVVDPTLEDQPLIDASYLSLYSLAMVALESDDPAVQSCASELTDWLIDVSSRQERTSMALTLSRAKFESLGGNGASGEVATIFNRMLDAVAPYTDPPRIVTTAVAEECVEVAESAADSGAWEVAMDALRRAFGGGPPLTALEPQNLTSSPFLLPMKNTRTARASVRILDNLNKLRPRIFAILKRHQTAGRSDDPSHFVMAYSALRDIVLPKSRASEAFPYESGLGKVQAGTEPESLSRELVSAAVKSGHADELKQQLDELRVRTTTPHLVDLLRVQLALAQADSEAIDRALSELATTSGIAHQGDPSQPETIKSSKMEDQESAANALVHAVIPVHQRDGVTPLVAAIEMHLLDEASRKRSLSGAAPVWTWMTNELLQQESVSDDDAEVAVDRFLSGVRLRYSGQSLTNSDAGVRAESLNLVSSAMKRERWGIVGRLRRTTAQAKRGFQQSSDTIAHFAIRVMPADAQGRYDVFSRIMLGDSADDELVSTAAMVLYVDPGEAFRSVTLVQQARQIPIGNTQFAVTSASLIAADAAAKCGRTDELIERLRAHVKEPGDEAEAMIGQAMIADGRPQAAGEILARVDEKLAETKPKATVKTPLPIESALFVARCLESEDLRMQARGSWDHLLMHGNHRDISLLMSLFYRVAMNRGMTHAAGGKPGSPWKKHWTSFQVPYRDRPTSLQTTPLYSNRDGTLRYGAGADQSILMLKYPLAGDFRFSHRNVPHHKGGSQNTFGGTIYDWRSTDAVLSVRGFVSRNTVKLNIDPPQGDQNAIELVGDEVRVTVHGGDGTTDQRTETMPFAGLMFYRNSISEVDQIRLEGDPVIPREVIMIDPQLRGWCCSILGGYMPDAHLPPKPSENLETLQRMRDRHRKDAKAQKTWYAHDGELLTGDRTYKLNSGDQRHIQYMRPLLPEESISYEFFYEPGKQEVHPTIGRIGVLLRPGGVKLRWLSQSSSLESFQIDALHEIEPDQTLGDGRPQLLEGDWNQLKVTSEGEMFVVEVNGKPVCRFVPSLDQRFGLLGEKDRSCRIRELQLTGAWPKTVPEDLFAD